MATVYCIVYTVVENETSALVNVSVKGKQILKIVFLKPKLQTPMIQWIISNLINLVMLTVEN